MIEGHGDDRYRYQYDVKIDFSTNVWYDMDKDIVRQMILDTSDSVFRYPEPSAMPLIKKIANNLGVGDNMIIVGNGATELFYIIAHAFKKKHSIIAIPSFKEYEDATLMYEHKIEYIDINGEIPAHGDLVWICNPNNPDGKLWSLEKIEHLLRQNKNRIIVIDESFINFLLGDNSSLPLLDLYSNLIIVRSMTKSYCVPGLRLGYMVTSKDLTAYIKNYVQPWAINSIAIAVGRKLIDTKPLDNKSLDDLFSRKQNFTQALKEIDDICVYPSSTSFFLLTTPMLASEIKLLLLEKYGILVRDASNFRSLSDRHIRINTLQSEENQLLVNAFKNILK